VCSAPVPSRHALADVRNLQPNGGAAAGSGHRFLKKFFSNFLTFVLLKVRSPVTLYSIYTTALTDEVLFFAGDLLECAGHISNRSPAKKTYYYAFNSKYTSALACEILFLGGRSVGTCRLCPRDCLPPWVSRRDGGGGRGGGGMFQIGLRLRRE